VTTMYRQTVGMPPEQQARLRVLLRTYTSAVEGRELDTQDTEGSTNTARGAVTEMYRIMGNQPANAASNPVSGELLAS
jgi:hypothetical protein